MENVVELIRDEHILTSKAAILKAMAAAIGLDYLNLCVGDWDRFFERVVLQVQQRHKQASPAIDCTNGMGGGAWS
jgi:hypothetical protein